MNVNYLIILVVTILVPILLTYFIYKIAFSISNYDFVRKRMNNRKTIVLLSIKKDGKLLFRKKKGESIEREEYKDTWVLPGGEIGFDEEINKTISASDNQHISWTLWAVAYAKYQTRLKIQILDRYTKFFFCAPYEGGIQMGYPPGEIAIFCGETDEDENTQENVKRILDDEIEDLKYFSIDEINCMSDFFHPFYIKHLEMISSLKEKIDRKLEDKKDINDRIMEEMEGKIRDKE